MSILIIVANVIAALAAGTTIRAIGWVPKERQNRVLLVAIFMVLFAIFLLLSVFVGER